jgi:hypothetical protein
MITSLAILAVASLAVAYFGKDKPPIFSSESQHYVFDILSEQGYLYTNNEGVVVRMIKFTKKQDMLTDDLHEEQILINPDGQVTNLGEQII